MIIMISLHWSLNGEKLQNFIASATAVRQRTTSLVVRIFLFFFSRSPLIVL